MSSPSGPTELRELEALVVGNPDLERLELLLAEFNLFEALGVVRQELRHSDFLSFILSPDQNHGLGDAFLSRFLQRVVQTGESGELPFSALDLTLWDLDDTTVLREWQNIDLLLVSSRHRLAVIIENKVGSTEHSGQLDRYHRTVAAHYPGWRILGIYLTPDGEAASDARYVSASYVMVVHAVRKLLGSRASTMGVEVRTTLEHYVQLLQRHVVSESEIADLCRMIYQRHKRALDLIYEHRPDTHALIRDVLKELIVRTPALIADHITKTYIRFLPKEWDLPYLTQGDGTWTPSRRILLFEFANEQALRLKLAIGPGEEGARRHLFATAKAAGDLKPAYNALKKSWNSIYSKPVLSAAAIENETMDELRPKIEAFWERFLQHDLPRVTNEILAALPSDIG